MQNKNLFLAVLCLFSSSLALADADSDFLAQQKINIDNAKSDQIVKQATGDLAAIFENFQPALDPSSTLVSPVVVSGPRATPTVQLVVRKCVAGLVCQDVRLVGEASVQASRGSCTKNYALHIDLVRSSDTLASSYDALNADLCYQKERDGSGSLTFTASAHHAPHYGESIGGNITQGQVLSFLKMQVAPITRAIQASIQQIARNGGLR